MRDSLILRLCPSLILLLPCIIHSSELLQQEGLFTGFGLSKIFKNSIYSIWIAGDIKGDDLPPPLKLSVHCSMTKADGTTWREFPISEHPNWPANRSIHASLNTSILFAESYQSCSIVAGHLKTLEILDHFPVDLISDSKSDSDGVSVFIQLDKPAYKPRETVHVRMITLNERNLPMTSIPLNLTVKDPKNIIIRREVTFPVSAKNGFRKFEFQLAKQLNLGRWTITVESGTIRESRTFVVEKYVLPKFLVKVTSIPIVLTLADSTVSVEVQSSYTYGKSLDGNCSLTMYAEGSKPGPLNVGYLKNGRCLYTLKSPTEIGKYHLEANVTESKSGRWAVGKNYFKVFQTEPFKITWLNPVATFKQGLPLDINLAISTTDKLSVSDINPSALTIICKYNSQSGETSEVWTSAIPLNGMVTFKIKPPKNSEIISLVVTYKHVTLHLPVPRPFQSASKLHLGISRSSTSNKYMRGSKYKFTIDASKPVLKRLSYILYDGIKVVDFQVNKEISEFPSKRGYLDVLLPPGVYTELKIFVFFIHDFSGPKGVRVQEFISASMTWETSNYIDLRLSREILEPAEDISLTFRTHPNSTIALRGIDQSALLLSQDSTNLDLDPTTVPYNPFWRAQNSPKPSLVLTSSSDFIEEFIKSGIGVLTNVKSDSAQKEGETPTTINGVVGCSRRRRPVRRAENDVDRPGVFDNEFYGGPVRTRTEFPEVWLWEEIETENETTVFKPKVPKVPDTITSWYITAFSLNEESGLAFTPFPKILQVFRPFFLTLNLPYSVIKMETFVLQVLVHNYLDTDIMTTVTFSNDENHFQFVDTRERGQQNVTRDIRILPQIVEVVEFVVQPLKLGNVTIYVKAVTEQAGDAVIRPLNVIAPGVIYSTNHFKKMVNSNRKNANGTFEYTARILTRRRRSLDSRSLKFTGDPMAPILDLKENSRVNRLIELPFGCGEQSMLGFYPNILALDYLQSLNMLTPQLKAIGIKNLEVGYQLQLIYLDKATASFKYHMRDMISSTWLTSFVLRCFTGARKYITIDDLVLINGLKFLISNQNNITGEFEELGKTLYPAYVLRQSHNRFGNEGGNVFRYATTAYVTLAIAEIFAEIKSLPTSTFSGIDRRLFKDAIIKGRKFISSITAETESDAYSLAIITATLHATNDPAMDRFYEKLEAYAKVTEGGDLKHYEMGLTASEAYTTPLSIEITAYALLTQLWRSQVAIANSVPIVKWLYSKRNEKGGFESTQDTVVALTALSKYARLSQMQADDSMDVQVTTNMNNTFCFNVKPNNSIALQELVLPPKTEWIEITFKGQGRCSLEYHEHHRASKPNVDESHFKIKARWIPITEADESFNLNLCINTIDEEQTGDVVAEVNLPSGYAFEEEDINLVLSQDETPKTIKNVDLKNGATKADVYYDFLSQTPTCVNLAVTRGFLLVSKHKARISVYEYMNTTKHGSVAYDPAVKKTVCDICLATNQCDIINQCARRR